MNAEQIKAVVSRDDFKRLKARAQVALFLKLTHGDGKLRVKDVATKTGMSYRNAQRAMDELKASTLSHIGP